MTSQRDDFWWEPNQLRDQLQSMDEFEFEHLIADLWEKQGWDAEVEQKSSDAGIDVRATRHQPYRRKTLIQAKRYNDNNPIGGPDIQQYSALKYQEPGVDEAIIITTGYFTSSAEDRARELNVKTIDGEDLLRIIENVNAHDIVDKYIGSQKSDGSNTTTNRDPRQDDQLGPEGRQAIEKLVGQDVDEFLSDESYKSTRALEKAEGWVKLNPYDAKRIGIFDDLLIDNSDIEIDDIVNDMFADQIEKIFPNESNKLIFLKEDIHLDDEGNIFVEDITEYVPYPAVKGEKRGPIIGRIERGVPDEHWMSENAEVILKGKEYSEELLQQGKKFFNSLSDQSQRNQQPQESSSRKIVDDESSYESGGYYMTIASTIGWLSSFFLMAFANQLSVVMIIPVLCWFILPIGIIIDSWKSGFLAISKIESVVYILVSIIPWIALLPGVIYLYRRNSVLSE